MCQLKNQKADQGERRQAFVHSRSPRAAACEARVQAKPTRVAQETKARGVGEKVGGRSHAWEEGVAAGADDVPQ